MSVIQYSETLSSKDVQIWDNAAFDNGESEGSAAVKLSWSSVKPLSINLSQSFESGSTKENQSPSMAEVESSVSTKSSASIKPLHANGIISNARKPPVLKAGFSGRMIPENGNQCCPLKDNIPEEINLDSEIEEIETEINRLTSRLVSLRLEKLRRNAKPIEKRGRIVAAKFKDPPKQSLKSSDEQGKIEESTCVSTKLNTPRRGVSLGPAEIMRGARRGISLGPVEIYSATKLKLLGKQDVTTPVPPGSTRRKSCYWKLQDIDELRVAKERGKSLTLSPKSRAKTGSKVQAPKEAATTIGSKKAMKKEDGVISSIQPKKLFTKDGEKSAPAKKPLKSGRVVASRYNQMSNGSNSAIRDPRKRSSPETEEDSKRSLRKRVSLAGQSQGEGPPPVGKRANKQLQNPSEVAIQKNLEDKTPLSVAKMLGRVPTVQTFRCMDESPRDSGPAKSASELVGRNSSFNMDNNDVDELDESTCHGLNFIKDEGTREHLEIRVPHPNDESPRDTGAAKRASQLARRKSLFNDDDEIPVFSFEEEDGEEN